jgi:hypothetical protein
MLDNRIKIKEGNMAKEKEVLGASTVGSIRIRVRHRAAAYIFWAFWVP